MPNIESYLLTQGVLGVACIMLGYVCVKLYDKNEKLQARIEELHEIRLKDSQDITKEVTQVLNGNSQNMAILSEKFEVAKRRQ